MLVQAVTSSAVAIYLSNSQQREDDVARVCCAWCPVSGHGGYGGSVGEACVSHGVDVDAAFWCGVNDSGAREPLVVYCSSSWRSFGNVVRAASGRSTGHALPSVFGCLWLPLWNAVCGCVLFVVALLVVGVVLLVVSQGALLLFVVQLCCRKYRCS